jgi:hypothetical protein
MSREVMKMALDALSTVLNGDFADYMDEFESEMRRESMTALRAELAKPEPEPVGYLREEDVEHWKRGGMACLYSTPSGIASFAFPVYRREDL